MATNEYLEAFLEKAKAMLPDWMYKQIYNRAFPASGGKAKARAGEIEDIEKALEDIEKMAIAKDEPEFEVGDLVTSEDEHFNEYNPVAEVVDVARDYVYTLEFEDSDITHEFRGADLEVFEHNPEPREDESREEFIERFMSDEEAMEDFPDEDQRLAVAISYWEQAQKVNQSQPTNSQVHVDSTDWERKGKIVKQDEEKQLVYGVVLEPERVDAQADIISSEEIEKAAHFFLKNSRVIGKKHLTKAEASVVESYIAPANFELGGEQVYKGSWVLVTKIEDEQLWQEIKQGNYNSFSVGGYGRRE